MNKLVDQKVSVLVQRHLALESQLASSLEQLNESTANVLAERGLKGPTADDVAVLEPMTRDVHVASEQVANGRESLLARINAEFGFSFDSLGDLIEEFGCEESVRNARLDILHRCERAQSSLISNQATLHYTFDFHRKYLAGVFHYDAEQQNYRSNGQSHDPPTGNLFGRTC